MKKFILKMVILVVFVCLQVGCGKYESRNYRGDYPAKQHCSSRRTRVPIFSVETLVL